MREPTARQVDIVPFGEPTLSDEFVSLMRECAERGEPLATPGEGEVAADCEIGEVWATWDLREPGGQDGLEGRSVVITYTKGGEPYDPASH